MLSQEHARLLTELLDDECPNPPGNGRQCQASRVIRAAYCTGVGLFLAFFAASCNAESADGQVLCPRREQQYQVEYAGAVAGTGQITLVPREGRRVDVALEMIVGPKTSGILLKLNGRGSCSGGVVRARFGGGYPDSSPVRVLGATLEALYATELSYTRFFGSWTAHVVIRETGKREVFHGYLREVADR